MKLEVNFNIWFAIGLIVITTFTILFTILSTKLAIINNEYDLKVRELQKGTFDYACDNGFQSEWYNCGQAFKNITGNYCIDKNGTKYLVCENHLKQ